MKRQTYEQVDVAGRGVRFYTSPGLQEAARLGAEEYAHAREAIPTWCLDSLPCGVLSDGTHAVVLIVRSDNGPADGPFRNEPWVVGGKWDMVTPWREFVRAKAIVELFGSGASGALEVSREPIGSPLGWPVLFATGWGKNADGPYGAQGVTLQYCYRLTLFTPIHEGMFRIDRQHSQYLILAMGESLPHLHPYILDVIELSGWLKRD